MHFTHVSHLATIVEHGLVADSLAQTNGLLAVEVGNVGIKAQRQRRAVHLPPGGVVADYVPFYFAPRSPMMSAIENGRVPTYTDGCDDIVYLETTVEIVTALPAAALFTDRNAALEFARFSADPADLDELVDWPLMAARYWANTEEDPDRRERRMAECLVHQRVPWQAFSRVVCRNQACAGRARQALASLGQQVPVIVIPSWYF